MEARRRPKSKRLKVFDDIANEDNSDSEEFFVSRCIQLTDTNLGHPDSIENEAKHYGDLWFIDKRSFPIGIVVIGYFDLRDAELSKRKFSKKYRTVYVAIPNESSLVDYLPIPYHEYFNNPIINLFIRSNTDAISGTRRAG